jgi:hypothetical protein
MPYLKNVVSLYSMLRLSAYIALFAIAALIGCRKDVGNLPGTIIPGNPAPEPEEPLDFTCVIFPKWFNPPADSVTHPDKQLMFWQYRPGTKTEVIYTLGEQLWSYNFITRQRYHLANYLVYGPSCNQKGWVVYSDYRESCVYKIKTNGDSLTRMNFDGGMGAHWDYTGTAIYYSHISKNKMYKIDVEGRKLDSIDNVPVPYSAFSKTSDKLYYGKVVNGIGSIACFDVSMKQETIVAPGVPSGQMAIDERDETLYMRSFGDTRWAVIRYHIPSKKLDTLFKDCDNLLFNSRPYISAGTNKVTFSCIFSKLLDPQKDTTLKIRRPRLLKWTRALEIEVDDPAQKINAVNVFP